jgi:WD40 repeat protein
VRFDPNDKYIAAGQGDGSIKIFNVFTGKQSYTLNTTMEEPMPITQIRYCLNINANISSLNIDGDPCVHRV